MKNISQSVSTYLQECRSAVLARCRALRGDGGSAIVELAVMLSIFGVPVLFGTVEMGTFIYGSIEVSNAAHAGTMYGMTSSTLAGDTAGMTAAAQSEASDFGANLIVTPTSFYACSASIGGTQYATQTAANSACSGAGNHPLQFVQVAVSGPVTPAIHCPGLPTTFNLTNTSVMEVEE